MGELLLGCSGWNYGETPDKGGWVYFIPIRTLFDEKYLKTEQLLELFCGIIF
jgi:hypothetical protein